MAHRDEQERLEFSVAIGGAADMDGRAAQPETDANDRHYDQIKFRFRAAKTQLRHGRLRIFAAQKLVRSFAKA